jgi:hypothetical protein
MPTVTIDSATEYSTTETSELSPVATDALFLFNDENSSTNGKVSILMRSAGGGGAASARITLKNERSGSGGLGFFFRDNGHTGEQQEKMYLSSDGDIDTAGLLKVGVNDSEYANNYIRFKPTGAAYIDHNTVGQDINFRTSASSSLDRTPLVVQSGGILVTGSVNVSSNVIQANGNQHVIGVWGTSGLQLIGQTGADNIVGTMGANEPLAFRTGSSERARIDASGNLMVGAGSTSTRTVLTSDAVFQSYYNAESAARVHLGRDVGIGGGAGVAFGGGGGYSLIGTDNTSGTNLYFNAGSNAVGNLTTGYQLMINGSTGVVIATAAGGSANKGILQFSTQAATYQLLGGNNLGYLGYKTGGYHRWFGSDGVEEMRLATDVLTVPGHATNGGTPLILGSTGVTQYTDLIIKSNSGNAEFFKAGTGYTDWGGGSALNIYNSNEKIAFHPSGQANVVQMTSAGIVMGAGKGISFAANANATNMANEIFDDYEEGTWTLAMASSNNNQNLSISNTTGSYVKIGRSVTVTIYTAALQITAAGTGSYKLLGLPFTCAGGQQSYACPSFGHTSCFSSPVDGYVAINNNFIVCTIVGTVSNNAFLVGSNKYLMMTVTYFTND